MAGRDRRNARGHGLDGDEAERFLPGGRQQDRTGTRDEFGALAATDLPRHFDRGTGGRPGRDFLPKRSCACDGQVAIPARRNPAGTGPSPPSAGAPPSALVQPSGIDHESASALLPWHGHGGGIRLYRTNTRSAGRSTPASRSRCDAEMNTYADTSDLHACRCRLMANVTGTVAATRFPVAPMQGPTDRQPVGTVVTDGSLRKNVPLAHASR